MAPGWDTRYLPRGPLACSAASTQTCPVGGWGASLLAGRLVRKVWICWPGSPLAGAPTALPGLGPVQEEPEEAGGERSHWFLLDTQPLLASVFSSVKWK